MMQSRIKTGRRDPAKPRLAGDAGPTTLQVFFFLLFPIE